jgi:succinate dehydrogenase / fumarate reductase iron-sulfur subunit
MSGPTPAPIQPAEPPPPPEVPGAAETTLSLEPPPAAEPTPEPAEPAAPTVHLRISRLRTGDRKPHFDEFECTPEPGATVLDVLIEIRRHRDPSLVIRHSCMHASCGTCGVRINGREALACDTKVAGLTAPTIDVEPLANQRPVADLATDMVDFYARLEAVGFPLVRSAEVAAGAEPPEGVKAYTRFENCIECGLCLSACPVSRTDRSYLGPAALAAAARVADEPRGQPLGPILALAAEPDSVWRCRDAMQCTAVCPSAVDPARALLGLRRRVAFGRVRSLLGRG